MPGKKLKAKYKHSIAGYCVRKEITLTYFAKITDISLSYLLRISQLDSFNPSLEIAVKVYEGTKDKFPNDPLALWEYYKKVIK